MSGHAAAHAALRAKAESSHTDDAHSAPCSKGGVGPRLSSVEQHMADLVADQAAEDAPTVYARFSDQPFFVITIAVAIILNAIQMGLELELRSDAAQTLWKVLENFFTAFFLGEMITKLIKDGVRDYFSLKANHLDFVIVLVAIVDNWILVLFMSDEDKEALSFLSLMKLVRLGRILKLLKMKRQLKLLVESIVNSLSSMFWLCVLLVILIYMISICMVQFVGRAEGIYTKKEFDNKKYFGDMISAGVTGLNLALLDGFGDVIRPVLKKQPLYCTGLLMYVGVAAFGIMNAIIGVIVTKTSDAAAQLERENDSAYRKRQMAFVANVSNIIYAIDTDGDGTVSPEEIEMASDNQELIDILQDIDLPFSFSLGDLHCMLDKDGDGELTKVEFFTGMRRLIFSNDFHRQCLLSLGIAQMKRKMFELRLEMEDGFKMLSSKIDILIDNAGKAPPEAVLPPVAKPAPPKHPRPGEEIPRPPSNQTPATIMEERKNGKIGEFVYLPFQVRGATVIVKEGIFWRVTNEYLQSTAELIECRSTKNLEDRAGEGAGILYGSLIQGVDDGDGWLRLALKEQVTEVHTALPEHSTSASSAALSPRLDNDPIPVCAIAKVTIPESSITKVPSDLDHPISGSSTAMTPPTKVHEPDRSTSTSLGAVVASSASSVEVQAAEKPVGVSPERVYLREMADPGVDTTPTVADPVADRKPTVFDKTAPKPAGITAPKPTELNPFRKETFPLSARSFSSDEGDEGDEGIDETEPIPVEIPKKAPQAAFADVLNEGYERRVHERENWLKSLSVSQEPVKTSVVHAPVRAFGAESLRFNQTRLAPPALRDPDIFEQVRKRNLEDPRYKARDEMPVNRPVNHMY